MISKDTEKLRETSMSEEYRKRLNDVITSRKQLQNQLSKDQTELQKDSKEDTTRNTSGSASTDGTTSQVNKTNTQRDQESSVVVNETSTEVEITQEMLRLKIIDVIGRFAGVASEYLNNFDLKRGPDVVFAVDNPLLATVVEKTIQWGLLRTPCPEDTLSIPQILFSDKYEADFWNEVIEAGLLEHLRIILTPVEKHTKIEMYCPRFVQKRNRKNNETLADKLISLELQGPLLNNRPTLQFSEPMFHLIADQDKFCNLTTLNLSGLELSQYQDDVPMSCKSLRSINISLCQIGQDDDSSFNAVSLSDILWLLTGKSDPIQSFPELLEFSFRNPVSSTKTKPVVWRVTDDCVPLMKKLKFLDITKTHIEADSVQKLFFGMVDNKGKRIGFGDTLATLVLDSCVVEGEVQVPEEDEAESKGKRSVGDAKEMLKLNCYNLKPVTSARIISFLANKAGKRTGRTVQIL
ncbi:hypothetical protein BDR26DRAFT_345607 [Obelidium mucronatum]|nr:hypothetical protein BDR26DRAFT_345607 [Obelidium mucronatum]